MTIDDKITAIEEFIAWREEAGITSPLEESLGAYKTVLRDVEREAVIRRVISGLEGGLADPTDLANELRGVL